MDPTVDCLLELCSVDERVLWLCNCGGDVERDSGAGGDSDRDSTAFGDWDRDTVSGAELGSGSVGCCEGAWVEEVLISAGSIEGCAFSARGFLVLLGVGKDFRPPGERPSFRVRRLVVGGTILNDFSAKGPVLVADKGING